jgi:hypothetical protein
LSGVVLICGTRSWDDHTTIRRVLRGLPAHTKIRHGGAPGADNIAAWIAHRMGIEVEPPFKPDYKRYGRWLAPFERNTEMLETNPVPKEVIAFWDGRSRGTLDTICKALARNIPVIIYTTPNTSKEVYRQQGIFNDWEMKFLHSKQGHKIKVKGL